MRPRTAANVALGLVSCLAGLALVEVALRLFLPKYEHLADASFVDMGAIRVQEPNLRNTLKHPDTGERHPWHHNNFGSRQHRNFSAAELGSSVNVGFFGDSWTENIRMAAHFSFTEPLDYMLNVNAGGRSPHVNVLNFGMGGYSTAQSLLRYETWELRETLDHVFYVFHRSDMRPAGGPFHLDGSGRLIETPAPQNPFGLLGRLHLSYLALDAAGHLSAKVEEAHRTDDASLRHLFDSQTVPHRHALFQQLLRRFKETATSHGASFQLVRLPNNAHFKVEAIIAEEGVETVDLWNCFAEVNPAHPHTPWMESPYRFKHDLHWNEAGNRLAAVCLHRYLAAKLTLPPLPDHEVARVLGRYYAAFDSPARDESPASVAIRTRYDALRGDGPAEPRRAAVPWTTSPDKLVIRSHFDVYLHDGWLAYVREDCELSDVEPRFFLHVVPRDLRDLEVHRLPSGFDNFNFTWRSPDRPPTPEELLHGSGNEASTCAAYRRLPGYAIESLKTGQFVQDESGDIRKLWAVEHFLAPRDRQS